MLDFVRQGDGGAPHPVSRLGRPSWLDEFEREHGRPLRVLHIGNIANNAYNNAKVLRKIGVEADVMCHNYYHMMGTPEWEDANFIGKHGDDFFPDWWRVNLNGFRRPQWFFQGPRELCFEVVQAKFDDPSYFKLAFAQLEFATNLICYRRSRLRDREAPTFDPAVHRRRQRAFVRYLVRLAFSNVPQFVRLLANIVSAWARTKRKGWVRHSRRRRWRFKFRRPTFRVSLPQPRNMVVPPVRWLYRRIAAPAFYLAGNMYVHATGRKFGHALGPDVRDRILNAAGRSIQYRASRPRAPLPAPEEDVGEPESPDTNDIVQVGPASGYKRRVPLESLSSSVRTQASGQTSQFWRSILNAIEGWFHRRQFAAAPLAPSKDAAVVPEDIEVPPETEVEDPTLWIEEHFNWHKDVDPTVLDQDVILANALGDGWKPIVKHYDVVQCYSVDGIIPMSHGRRDYLCYEHGTLRSIPFEPTPIGRLTATAYRLGTRSFVTNLDNLESCRRLKLARDRIVPLPHALDDEKIHSFARKHTHIRPSGHDAPEFLSPARQHWLDKDPNLAKGNDIFFDALARLKAQGYRARVTLVAWGRDIEASKTYTRDIGIDDFVTWVPPMTGEELWKRYLGCHAVVDQFIIPAFGRVTFDSLLFGRPVITNLDVDLATEFFGVAPPILVSASVDDAERALKRILDDPEDKQGIGAASGAWAATYHSTQRILDLQVEAYRQTIAERTANAAHRVDLQAAG